MVNVVLTSLYCRYRSVMVVGFVTGNETTPLMERIPSRFVFDETCPSPTVKIQVQLRWVLCDYSAQYFSGKEVHVKPSVFGNGLFAMAQIAAGNAIVAFS